MTASASSHRLPRRLATSVLLVLCAPLLAGADDTGCRSESSSDVAQERIFTSYWALYDAASDQTFLRAQFRIGSPTGTTLVLEDGAEVSFDGVVMGFNETLDWHETARAGRVTGGDFQYVDVDGATYVNPLPAIVDTEFPTDFPATLPNDAAYALTWDGPALGPDDAVEVVVARSANRFDFASFWNRTPDATSVVLDAEGLSNVGAAPAVTTLRRWRRTPVPAAPEAGGTIATTYQTAERVVTLE
ncbi:MAG: hypothetical protein AAF715_10805 [Myxococcota bacterium]